MQKYVILKKGDLQKYKIAVLMEQQDINKIK